MEATGHYWQNLFAFLVAEGFAIALLNPLRTRRFSEVDLERTKNDAIDAVGIAPPHGNTVKNPASLASVTVTFRATALALASTPPRPPTCNCNVVPPATTPPDRN